MKLIKLTTTPEKLEARNVSIRRCKEEFPDFNMEEVHTIEDLIPSYQAVLDDPECVKIISDVKDTLTNFDGVYMNAQLECIDDYINEKIKDNNPFYIGEKFGVCEYGVCDNASQAIDHFKNIEKERGIDFGNCVLCLRPIVKKNQPADGGWRWHKWGPYIGVKHPECEYIYDEGDDINFVWCYHLYGVE